MLITDSQICLPIENAGATPLYERIDQVDMFYMSVDRLPLDDVKYEIPNFFLLGKIVPIHLPYKYRRSHPLEYLPGSRPKFQHSGGSVGLPY